MDELSPARQSMKFYNWMKNNNCLINKTKNIHKEKTHLSLCGGKYCVPNHLYQDFLKMMSDVLNNEEELYISENRTDIFRFIVDVDYEDEKILSDDVLNEILKIIHSVLVHFIKPDVDKSMLILKPTDFKKKIDPINEEIIYKSGIHIYFKNIFITSDTAILLRSAIIQKLNEYKLRPKYNPWEKVIDLSIYKGCGLRMPGNFKIERCKQCKKSKDQNIPCPHCNNYGKLNGKRPYLMYKYYDDLLNEDEKECELYKSDILKLLKDTSLRTDLVSENFKINDSYPVWFSYETYRSEHLSEKKIVKNKITSKNYENNIKYDLIIDNTLMMDLLKEHLIKHIYNKSINIKFLNNHNIPKNICDDIEMGSLKKKIFKNKSIYTVCFSNFKFCLNKDEYHTSNNIYLIINHKGEIYQRCHSESIGKNNMCCKKFKKLIGKCTDELYQVLFENKKITQKLIFKEELQKLILEDLSKDMKTTKFYDILKIEYPDITDKLELRNNFKTYCKVSEKMDLFLKLRPYF